jgi:hypothetical protein
MENRGIQDKSFALLHTTEQAAHQHTHCSLPSRRICLLLLLGLSGIFAAMMLLHVVLPVPSVNIPTSSDVMALSIRGSKTPRASDHFHADDARSPTNPIMLQESSNSRGIDDLRHCLNGFDSSPSCVDVMIHLNGTFYYDFKAAVLLSVSFSLAIILLACMCTMCMFYRQNADLKALTEGMEELRRSSSCKAEIEALLLSSAQVKKEVAWFNDVTLRHEADLKDPVTQRHGADFKEFCHTKTLVSSSSASSLAFHSARSGWSTPSSRCSLENPLLHDMQKIAGHVDLEALKGFKKYAAKEIVQSTQERARDRQEEKMEKPQRVPFREALVPKRARPTVN